MPLFVWIDGQSGPTCQVFHDIVMGEASIKDKKVLFSQEVSKEAALKGLHGLAEQFPCPVKENLDGEG